MTHHERQRGRYVRLPDEATFRALFEEHAGDVINIAGATGATTSGVRRRCQVLGLEPIRRPSVRGPGRIPGKLLLARIVDLEASLVELEERVHALEARPITAIAVREDHRRIADGGQGARHARRAG